MSNSSNDHDASQGKPLTSSDLAQFTGTEQLYRHALVRHIRYTDGVRYVAKAGEAYWLLDKIACLQLDPRVRAEEFQLWTLTVKADRSARLVCSDGNGGLVLEEAISFTDFPLAEVEFYVTDNTILLPSEY